MQILWSVLLVIAILSDLFWSRRYAKRSRLIVEELKEDIARLLQQRELSKIEYKPGDVFVLQCKERLSSQGYYMVRENLRAQLGDGVKVLVVPHDMTLTVAELSECT